MFTNYLIKEKQNAEELSKIKKGIPKKSGCPGERSNDLEKLFLQKTFPEI